MSPRAKICQIVPTTFHGISSGRAMITSVADAAAPLRRHRQGQGDPERDLDREDGQAEDQLADHRVVEIAVAQDLREPVGADPDPVGRAEDVLERVVDHGHQRDDRAERHQQEDREDQQPGAVVVRLVHVPPRQPISRPSA